VHGGADQAVYLYGRDDYDAWADELDRPLPGGMFGENLTLSSLGLPPIRVGDRFRIGDVLLEVTSPRVPCATFQEKLGEPDWVRRFRAAGRPGAYCRVLAGGEVAPGDAVERIPAPVSNITLDELEALYFDRAPDPERLRVALASPVASRARDFLERRLGRRDGA
jgi:MOSC domain-containing protein YiiM